MSPMAGMTAWTFLYYGHPDIRCRTVATSPEVIGGSRPALLALHQHTPQDLAGRRLRHLIDELD